MGVSPVHDMFSKRAKSHVGSGLDPVSMHSSAARPRDLAPSVERVRTFADLPPGAAFWYENSNGLAEIAINQGRADRELGLSIGTLVEIVS